MIKSIFQNAKKVASLPKKYIEFDVHNVYCLYCIEYYQYTNNIYEHFKLIV